jgi:hypothetical protein
MHSGVMPSSSRSAGQHLCAAAIARICAAAAIDPRVGSGAEDAVAQAAVGPCHKPNNRSECGHPARSRRKKRDRPDGWRTTQERVVPGH